MEVRIGIVQSMKELEIELPEDASTEELQGAVEASLKDNTVLWLTDRRGRRVGVAAERIAYVELGAPASDRRVGFGTP